MEETTERLVQSDEGVSSPAAIADDTTVDSTVVGDQIQTPPAGYEGVAPELWPGPDGKPPKLTEALMRTLRGKYFTVKHPLLANCGHKLDMINQPSNNCENCWYSFFNSHPQLVEVADQFYRTQGRGPMIGMRGLKFVKNFTRFMATVLHFMEEEKRNNVARDQESGSTTSGNEGGETASQVASADEGAEAQSDQRPDEIPQQ